MYTRFAYFKYRHELNSKRCNTDSVVNSSQSHRKLSTGNTSRKDWSSSTSRLHSLTCFATYVWDTVSHMVLRHGAPSIDLIWRWWNYVCAYVYQNVCSLPLRFKKKLQKFNTATFLSNGFEKSYQISADMSFIFQSHDNRHCGACRIHRDRCVCQVENSSYAWNDSFKLNRFNQNSLYQ